MRPGIQPARFLTYSGAIRPGVRRVVPVANPAAAADFSVAVPAGNMWRVIGLYAFLTTSATVNNRFVGFTVTVNGKQIWATPTTAAITASGNGQFCLASGLDAVSTGGTFANNLLPLPDAPLPQGSIISSATGGISAGDQWSAIGLYVEEYWFTDEELADNEIAAEDAERRYIDQLERIAAMSAGS